MLSGTDEKRFTTWLWHRARRIFRVLLIVLVTAIALGTGIWWWLSHRSPIHQGNVALELAYQSQRPLESRISGFDYAPMAQPRGGDVDGSDHIALKRAARLLLDAAFSDSTPPALHALGRYYLARKEFSKAADQFTRALQAAPRDASLYNDQGVARMEQSKVELGESGKDIKMLASALENFNRALDLKPNLPEAIFNRALLYQNMLLGRQARDEWRNYLKYDVTSPWAEEARKNLSRLKDYQPEVAQSPAQLAQSLRQAHQLLDDEQAWNIVIQHRDRTGSIAVRKLADDCLAALTKGDSLEAKRILGTLTYIGALEARKAGDRFVSDLASSYLRAVPGRQADLLKAQASLKSGLERFDSGDIEDAKRLLAQAHKLFYKVGDNAESLLAEYLLSRCYRKQSELTIRTAIHERLARDCERFGYKWLLTQIFVAQVSLQSSLANHSYVMKRSRRVLELARSIDDINSAGRSFIQAAESHHEVGNHHRAMKLYHEGIALINSRPAEPWVRWALYMSIAFPLNSLGHHEAAAEYQRESVRVANAMDNPKQKCLSYINLALTYGLLRNYEEAIKNAQLAFDLAQTITRGFSRAESLALVTLKLAELHLHAGEFIKAGEVFDQAIRLYNGVDSQEALLYSAHKGRLLASLARGGAGSLSLEDEIRTVLKLFEAYRVKIREESNRNSFFDVEQSVYDIAIDFWHTRKQDTQTAFDLAERCRARSLLDLVSSAPRTLQDAVSPDLQAAQIAPPLTLTEIRARMPEQSQIVQYAVLKDRLLIWVISATQPLASYEQKISAEELSEKVTAYLRLVSQTPTGDRAAEEASKRFYSLLIQPIARLLDKQKRLCIVPDKILNHLPYAALISPGSGRFLIEDHSVVFSPSATMFVICSSSAVKKGITKGERLLSVGDPSFNRNVFPSLPYLPSARREAEIVATYYPQSHTMIGGQATKRLLAGEIGRFDVLHLALHCVVDERSPMRSKLLLADPAGKRGAEGEFDGVLQAYEIYRLPLSRLRLVVLSACRSGVERYYGGEGMVGVSRPFIAKGVPLVVASLWEVDSDATTEMMTRFHEYRKRRSLPTAEALRQAQLSLLHSPGSAYRHPFYWAAFECIGGYAEF